MSSECKLVEKLSDEVASFRLSRKANQCPAARKTGVCYKFSNASPVMSRDNGRSFSKRKPQSLFRIVSYLAVISLAGYVQYLGGVNEFVVELMAYSYQYYGVMHGGPRVYVETNYGKLKGFTSVSREGREFYEFLGIEYALSPVGDLRFQPPVPPKKHNGVKDATGYGEVCFQYDLFLQAVMGSENCLTLNIYTPNLPSMNRTEGKLYPVLVFIYGGMYMFGRAIDFRGNFFMDEDVVVCSNNGDRVVRGNMGLKEQVMALQYIQENIAYFGGDPDMVTIWGESAGGVSAQLHMLSPMSQGLFHRVIASSGFSLDFIRNETVKEQINKDWNKHGPVLIDYEDLPEWERNDMSKRIWNYYLGNKSMEMDTLYEVVDLFSDASFNKPLLESVNWYSRKSPMHLYMYSHRGDFGVAQIYFKLTLKVPILIDGLIMNVVSLFKKIFNIPEPHFGTCHADEQALFFKMHPLLSSINPGHREFAFSRELVRVWASFAKTGKPDSFSGHYWEPVESGKPYKFMKLTDERDPGMMTPPWMSRLSFLNTLPGFQCLDREFMNSSTSTDGHSICF